jgi:hypothetical protein
MHRRVQKARGSLGMCSRFSIWLTKFSKSFCSSADIIIDGLARSLTLRARLLVFIGMRGSKWTRDGRLSWSGMSAPIDLEALSVDNGSTGSTSWWKNWQENIYHPRSVHESEILTPGKFEVFVITCTPKKHPEEAKARSDWLLNQITSRQRE